MIQASTKKKTPINRGFPNILLDAEKNIKQIKDLNIKDYQETFTY